MYKERQGRPTEKKRKSFQPQQSQYSLQPPPFSQTSPPFLANFIQDGRKWGKHPGISAKLKTQEEDVELKEWHVFPLDPYYSSPEWYYCAFVTSWTNLFMFKMDPCVKNKSESYNCLDN